MSVTNCQRVGQITRYGLTLLPRNFYYQFLMTHIFCKSDDKTNDQKKLTVCDRQSPSITINHHLSLREINGNQL